MKTSRYSNWTALAPTDLVKVGVTAYPPRFPLRYPLVGNIGLLAPSRALLAAAKAGKLADGEFRRIYLEQLDAIGLDKIQAALAEKGFPEHEVVLLCYENLCDGLTCHRRMFAEWWLTKTGEALEELPDAPSATPAKKKAAKKVHLPALLI